MDSEIIIKIEKHTGNLSRHGEIETWYSYTIERDTEDCIAYGMFFNTPEGAEAEARKKLTDMVELPL